MTVALLGLGCLVFFVAWWMTGRLCSPDSWLYLLDHPNERSLHSVPTPRTGGVAILGALSVGLVIAWGAGALEAYAAPELTASAVWLLALTAVLAILSLLDDRMKLPVAVKLLTHISMACGVVWGAGLIIRTIDIPLAGTIALGWLGAVLTVAFIVWMINLYNFMDGMDGFAGGMTVLGFGFLSLFGWMRQHQFMLAVSAMVSVATAGFLIYNMPPARIFMGDVGSTVIGFLAAVLVVTGVHGGVFSLWVPMLIFSPFIVDATATLFRRLFRGERIWEAHRQHYYQRLVLAGWGHRAVVLSEYGLMLLCGAAATVYSRVGDGWRLLILGVWVVTFVVLAGTVRNLERRHAVSPRG